MTDTGPRPFVYHRFYWVSAPVSGPVFFTIVAGAIREVEMDMDWYFNPFDPGWSLPVSPLWDFPISLRKPSLFQPDIFASRFFASLGHLLVISVSVLATGKPFITGMAQSLKLAAGYPAG